MLDRATLSNLNFSLDKSEGANACTPPPTDVATLLQWMIQRDGNMEEAVGRRKIVTNKR